METLPPRFPPPREHQRRRSHSRQSEWKSCSHDFPEIAQVRIPFLRTPSASTEIFSTAWIGAGLALLFTSSWLPNVPVVTAMALIALGATEITLARLRDTSTCLPLIILHGTVYASLYALFVGARLAAAAGHSTGPSLGHVAAFDVVTSLIPAVLVTQRLAIGLRQSISSKQ
jgi:hypothetical protein